MTALSTLSNATSNITEVIVPQLVYRPSLPHHHQQSLS